MPVNEIVDRCVSTDMSRGDGACQHVRELRSDGCFNVYGLQEGAKLEVLRLISSILEYTSQFINILNLKANLNNV
jgi:hypothetical protein